MNCVKMSATDSDGIHSLYHKSSRCSFVHTLFGSILLGASTPTPPHGLLEKVVVISWVDSIFLSQGVLSLAAICPFPASN